MPAPLYKFGPMPARQVINLPGLLSVTIMAAPEDRSKPPEAYASVYGISIRQATRRGVLVSNLLNEYHQKHSAH